MKKYMIIDNTSNTGKGFIDENGDNCIEENAAIFEAREDAESVAQSLTKEQIYEWEEWATIVEIDKNVSNVVRSKVHALVGLS